MPAIYSARWVLPIKSSPIDDGAVAIDGSKIVAVGPKAEVAADFPDAEPSDFGQAVILPGLVNTHSHLELTVMRCFLEGEEHDFFAWLRKLTLARMALTEDELRLSAACGATEAARAGITCLGDSSSLATQTLKALRKIGLRGVVYQESFGPDPKLAGENVAKLRDQIAEARMLETNLLRTGVSPHAPYTVSGPQLELISRLAIDERLPLMMHAAESQSETLFMRKGTGPFADGLRKRGIEWHAPGTSTVEYLTRHGVLDTQPLLAHCIAVDDGDLELIKKNRAGIAHCPKSNAKLRHGRAPFAKFVSNGMHVGLGSDSVASNNVCDILEEARFGTLIARLSIDSDDAFRAGPASSSVTANDALFAATLGGARALHLEDQIGALAEGMQADITIVRLDGAHQNPLDNPVDALIFSSSGRDVLLTMVAGKEIYRDGQVTTVNGEELQQRLTAVRRRLESTHLA
jgi:cytosine/adenosine deaminase-related metal-dependent hydrolase